MQAHSFLNPTAVLSYRVTLEKEAHLFALRLVDLVDKKRLTDLPINLAELTRVIRRMTTAVSVMISYGVDRGFLNVNNS